MPWERLSASARDPTAAEDAQRAQSTANRVWTNLRAALGYGFSKGRLSNKVWERIKPFKGVDAAKVRFLDQGECKRLIECCTGDFKLIAQGALYTAARYGELCALRVRDYDPTIDKLHIKPEHEKAGKGRHVTLTVEGAAFFASICANRKPDEFMFLHTEGELKGKPWGHSNQRFPLNQACDRAGIKPRIGFHILRKSVGAHLVKAGVPLQYVAQLLGHSSVRMTERHYGHLTETHVSETLRLKMPSFV